MIMPKQFLKGVDREWTCGTEPFHGLRFDPVRGERRRISCSTGTGWRLRRSLPGGRSEFRLRIEPRACGLGTGQLGIRGLIGTSFAGIFFDNCARNGLLAITLDAEPVQRLSELAANPATAMLTVDLPMQTIVAADGRTFPFTIDPGQRRPSFSAWTRSARR